MQLLPLCKSCVRISIAVRPTSVRITVCFYIMDYPRLSVLLRHTSKNNQLVPLQIHYLKAAGGQLTQNRPADCSRKTEAELPQGSPTPLPQQVGLSSEEGQISTSCSKEVQLAGQQLRTE